MLKLIKKIKDQNISLCNSAFMRLRVPKNLKFGHFMLQIGREWERNVQILKRTCRAIVLLINAY